MQYISSYKEDWPRKFEKIIAYLKTFLPEYCEFHHIGSTSIPGMPAKDIIDIDVEHDHGDLAMIVNCLQKAGYEHLGDLGITGREAFKTIPDLHAALLPEHHLYACETGAHELQKHLSYRDYLLANPDRALWLGKKKILTDAAARSRDEYIENKSCYYEIITDESMAWSNKRLNIEAAKNRGAS